MVNTKITIVTLHKMKEECKNCPWCEEILADEENRLWTVCDKDHSCEKEV